ncbi:MAG: 16S rRNA (cytidine(1402)-2'-O)-methyltransferase [marine benthic group bacterium]|jgi:16S rRNA (cytidine1402-2'-O)-methyltransferase|nr:16S rRNA (cytidine(1402)-2'-O)-methyltransferase [Gemmatimonadota bacterium]
MTESALYLVGTPIGNLDDLSPRGAATLAGVDRVYAEDTRRTSRLFRQFGIQTPLRSLHQHNEASRSVEVIELLSRGGSCALVTDAGAPGVSDPGARLVHLVGEAGHRVLTVPGPSAVTAAAGLSGFPADAFLFLGFAPRKGKDRSEWLRLCATSSVAVVAFEAPGRVARLLHDWAAADLGDRECCVCRELTKLHEEVRRGTVRSLADYYESREVRGEVTLVLAPPADDGDLERGPEPEAIAEQARSMCREGMGAREISEALQHRFGLRRNEAYSAALAAREEEGRGR